LRGKKEREEKTGTEDRQLPLEGLRRVRPAKALEKLKKKTLY